MGKHERSKGSAIARDLRQRKETYLCYHHDGILSQSLYRQLQTKLQQRNRTKSTTPTPHKLAPSQKETKTTPLTTHNLNKQIDLPIHQLALRLIRIKHRDRTNALVPKSFLMLQKQPRHARDVR